MSLRDGRDYTGRRGSVHATQGSYLRRVLRVCNSTGPAASNRPQSGAVRPGGLRSPSPSASPRATYGQSVTERKPLWYTARSQKVQRTASPRTRTERQATEMSFRSRMASPTVVQGLLHPYGVPGTYPYPPRDGFVPTPDVKAKHGVRAERFDPSKLSTKLYRAVVGHKAQNMQESATNNEPELIRTDVTIITQKDYLAVREVFLEIDDDANGFLSLRELIEYRTSNPKKLSQEVFQNLVLDPDGKIYLDEFLKCHFPNAPTEAVESAIEMYEPKPQDITVLSLESRARIMAIYKMWAKDGKDLTLADIMDHAGQTGMTFEDLKELCAERFIGGALTPEDTLSVADFTMLAMEYFLIRESGQDIMPLSFGHKGTTYLYWSQLFPHTGEVSNYFRKRKPPATASGS